jgi:hypothetical protein
MSYKPKRTYILVSFPQSYFAVVATVVLILSLFLNKKVATIFHSADLCYISSTWLCFIIISDEGGLALTKHWTITCATYSSYYHLRSSVVYHYFFLLIKFCR